MRICFLLNFQFTIILWLFLFFERTTGDTITESKNNIVIIKILNGSYIFVEVLKMVFNHRGITLTDRIEVILWRAEVFNQWAGFGTIHFQLDQRASQKGQLHGFPEKAHSPLFEGRIPILSVVNKLNIDSFSTHRKINYRKQFYPQLDENKLKCTKSLFLQC